MKDWVKVVLVAIGIIGAALGAAWGSGVAFSGHNKAISDNTKEVTQVVKDLDLHCDDDIKRDTALDKRLHLVETGQQVIDTKMNFMITGLSELKDEIKANGKQP